MAEEFRDEIRLTNMQRPRMEPRVHHCYICGLPMTTLGRTCVQCFGKTYLTEALEQQREQLAAHPDYAWETAFDRGRLLHLVLVANRRLAWCGRKVVQAPEQRRRFQAPFPADLCAACRQVYDGLIP